MIPSSPASISPPPDDPRCVAIFGLPPITRLEDLADQLRLSRQLVYGMCFGADHFYRECHIPKRSGGLRRSFQPSRTLKAVQAWILRRVLDRVRSAPASRGFEIGQSTRSNALPHTGCNVVLRLDIEDFFESVSAKRVFGIFRSIGYPRGAAALLTNLTTVRGFLPQGAPTSPKLANLACYRLDQRLAGLSGRRNVVFTRYADDMTFSSVVPDRVRKIRRTAERIVKAEGFRPNVGKTKLTGPSGQRRVTGLVVRYDDVGLPRQVCRRIRAMIHRLSKMASDHPDTPTAVSSVRGWLGCAKSVDPARHQQLLTFAWKLVAKNPQSSLSSLLRPIATPAENQA